MLLLLHSNTFEQLLITFFFRIMHVCVHAEAVCKLYSCDIDPV